MLPLESDGNFTWHIVRDEMDSAAQEQMRAKMQQLIDDGWWKQNWHDGPALDHATLQASTLVAPGAVESVVLIADDLPDGRLVHWEERAGYFAWKVLRGHITEKARAEMQAQMQYLQNTRQWLQVWDDHDRPAR
ncbi:hypothetical protein ABZ439_12560 [Streptomyces sp. NPDC005840]|uniref:Uncharacterized protein n=1 Tax=Streptomyces doudnae TaxID=3075536 RepID=A0ABD5EX71_9ACTN|nr:hypothetical protein [Streptomyces sp. DSM 41981]